MLQRVFLLLASALALATPALAGEPQSFEARVVGVSDGDTITVLDRNNVQHKIRLAGIDAPEKAQAFGEKSRQSLARMVFGKDVRIESTKRDRYGRLVAKVWVTPIDLPCAKTGEPCPKTLDVSRAQLTVGLAWHYKKYELEQSEEDRLAYAFEEHEARARKVGLWQDPDPTPPWQYRHGPTDGPVKKSRNDICHAPGSSSYQSVKYFTPWDSLEECLASGGRLPK